MHATRTFLAYWYYRKQQSYILKTNEQIITRVTKSHLLALETTQISSHMNEQILEFWGETRMEHKRTIIRNENESTVDVSTSTDAPSSCGGADAQPGKKRGVFSYG